MKAFTQIINLVIVCALAVVENGSAQQVVVGHSLNIGTNNGLLTTFGGNLTLNSVSGGQNNTNNSQLAGSVGGGGPNALMDPSVCAVIAGGAYNTNYASRSAICGGENNSILLTNGLPTAGDNQNVSEHSVICGGIGNRLLGQATAIGGGSDNVISAYGNYSVISGGAQNRILYACSYGTISGGTGNKISGAATWAAINGGSRNEIEGLVPEGFILTNDQTNQFLSTYLSGHYGWIGGGLENYINLKGYFGSIGGGGRNTNSGGYSTIAGGDRNVVAGDWAAIPGGSQNLIRTNASYTAISGGQANVIGQDSSWGVIGGGSANLITNGAIFGTILGGQANVVSASYGLAAGYVAKAAHSGAFVFSDASSSSAFSSTAANEFSVRATGGFRFLTGTSSGATLAPGGGSWSSLSDRNAKTNFASVNTREILDRVATLPLSSWNYKSQDESIRHVGPMAQDFHAAFGVGENSTTITTVDADGVALAAIQALNEIVKEKESALEAQQKLLREQSILVRQLSERLELLEKAVGNHQP